MSDSHCKYVSKPCYNTRSLKDDGTPHRFCAFHRQRANDAQRRWHARRRQNSESTCESTLSGSSDESDASSRKRRRCGAPEFRDAASMLALGRTAPWIAFETAWETIPMVSYGQAVDQAFGSDELRPFEEFVVALDDVAVENALFSSEGLVTRRFEHTMELRL